MPRSSSRPSDTSTTDQGTSDHASRKNTELHSRSRRRREQAAYDAWQAKRQSLLGEMKSASISGGGAGNRSTLGSVLEEEDSVRGGSGFDFDGALGRGGGGAGLGAKAASRKGQVGGKEGGGAGASCIGGDASSVLSGGTRGVEDFLGDGSRMVDRDMDDDKGGISGTDGEGEGEGKGGIGRTRTGDESDPVKSLDASNRRAALPTLAPGRGPGPGLPLAAAAGSPRAVMHRNAMHRADGPPWTETGAVGLGNTCNQPGLSTLGADDPFPIDGTGNDDDDDDDDASDTELEDAGELAAGRAEAHGERAMQETDVRELARLRAMQTAAETRPVRVLPVELPWGLGGR